jgi:hypothetical protein
MYKTLFRLGKFEALCIDSRSYEDLVVFSRQHNNKNKATERLTLVLHEDQHVTGYSVMGTATVWQYHGRSRIEIVISSNECDIYNYHNNIKNAKLLRIQIKRNEKVKRLCS